MAPALKALIAQLGSLAFLWAIGRSGVLVSLSLLQLALLQGGLAALFAGGLGAARWWLPIHLAFLPAVVLAFDSGIPPGLYLAAFGLLMLIYWSSFRTQVPLFLSNKLTIHRLISSLPDRQPLRVLDVGSGTGSAVWRMARMRPDWRIGGIESAPAPFWLSRRRCRDLSNVQLLRDDFWRHPLHQVDVLYAFLSPVPMQALWAKAAKEMPAGSLLVSNSFPVPGRQPERVIEVGDRRRTQLFCYRIPGRR